MRVFGLLWTGVLSACSTFGVRSGYEQPRYDVVAQLSDAVEVRRYPPHLVAETVVDAPDAEAGQNAAFELLAAYIFGANRGDARIAMTAPVEVAARPETLAMTAPVETTAVGANRYRMRFFLPARYTLDNAPPPNDARVRLVVAPERTIAALRFSGSGRPQHVVARQQQLLHAVEASGWRSVGTPVSFFYDPPWTIPFLRRNEVAVAVAPT